MAQTQRIFRCTGTSGEPHDEVEWTVQWDTLTAKWITDDGKALPCWMCGTVPWAAT